VVGSDDVVDGGDASGGEDGEDKGGDVPLASAKVAVSGVEDT
jgi:hypothetical protein